jgi:hypothetical protein
MLPTTQTLFNAKDVQIKKELAKVFLKVYALNLIKKMTNDFFAKTDTKFETLYAGWEIEAVLYGLELPSEEDCDKDLNHEAINELRFAEYFINHFKL